VRWTHGTWTVTSGRETDFAQASERPAEWTVSAFPGARATLLRDAERPNVFISFGPWPDSETVARWRASPEFQEHLDTIRETLASFEARSLEHVATKQSGVWLQRRVRRAFRLREGGVESFGDKAQRRALGMGRHQDRRSSVDSSTAPKRP